MGYYSEKLSGKRLQECYEIAPPRVKQYLDAEIDFVRSRLGPGGIALELGCGYGRVAVALAGSGTRIVGIDTSEESLRLARDLAGAGLECDFLCMDALRLGFPDGLFDAVVCIQNGICAFGVDSLSLLREALRVTHPGGRAVFSSYADRFWRHRLEWFELQSKHGLLGEIDREATGNGAIVCRDGFRAGALNPAGFEALCARAGVAPSITEVDGSSVFCEVTA